jgi:hypothetical protein
MVAAGAARADRLTTAEPIPAATPLSAHVAKKLTLAGDQVGAHLNALTLDLVDVHFDFASRTGQFRIGATGDGGGRFAFRLDGDAIVRHGITRISPRIDLSLGGNRWVLDLPDVEVVPPGVDGARATELRLPIFEGRF